MDDTAAVLSEVVATLRDAGARFAYLFGSRAVGTHRPDSDIDVAAYFSDRAPASWEVLLPTGVDLLVLDSAPLELAGRAALHGQLVFDDDPVTRVRWEATTRKIYLDEQPRVRRAERDFAAAVQERSRRGR